MLVKSQKQIIIENRASETKINGTSEGFHILTSWTVKEDTIHAMPKKSIDRQ